MDLRLFCLWQIEGKTVETVTDFILGGSKITATSTSLVAQTVKHLSTMRETRVQSLVWEDPL